MCSMSTGHWLTQAPQVVQDHRASESMTAQSWLRWPEAS